MVVFYIANGSSSLQMVVPVNDGSISQMVVLAGKWWFELANGGSSKQMVVLASKW
jgi:hypothetical protein